MNTIEKKKLRADAHRLKPVVTIGQAGLTEAVIAETEITLNDHELVKIKIRTNDRELRKQLTQTLCQRTRSELIQQIGQISVIYRKNPNN
ncbi:MAG: ribosome assembly RNA-binding protein YhbY [Methylococcales bacterium]|nr:ribosome assembly RNA-binding protein YhbY [Methylococcaceae bacterium]HIL40657.1 ribosome assembly RNA-binding protein YhbY [Methylococcales bacterium]